jgi:hypothetical protein
MEFLPHDPVENNKLAKEARLELKNKAKANDMV